MTNLRKWADEAQYVAAPIEREEGGEIVPRAHLLWMTPDPLGSIAAMCRMYEGKPTYSLSEISDDERLHYFEQAMATHLKAPLEAVKFHFFFEGVTRSFTHQMVRQRTAAYAQESLRFSVKEDLEHEISLPPSIAALKINDHRRELWDEAITKVSESYNYLVANGIPAEDARGLMPHAVATRLNYVSDLRNMSEHAGNRLCTQAQFEWRIVWLGILQAIRTYTPDFEWAGYGQESARHTWIRDNWEEEYRWQFELLSSSPLFRPVCYQLGRCPFKASFDRACTIRDRVDSNAAIGRPSSEWNHSIVTGPSDEGVTEIRTEEWLLDPAAARSTSGGAGHE